MENLKIRIENEAESREAQELFFELGLRFVDVESFDYPQWLAVTQEGGTFSNYSGRKTEWHTCSPKEIALPQLRDMVVLKRNDVGDATHMHLDGSIKSFIGFGNVVYDFYKGKWNITCRHPKELKPIEKPMKEYLVEVDGIYQYRLIPKDEAPCDGWIEIPKGADEAYFFQNGGIEFYKENKGFYFDKGVDRWEKLSRVSWVKTPVWQRNKSVNDRCVVDGEAKQKHSHYKKDVSHLNVLDVYRVLELFEVDNPCLQHSIKKLLCAGKRGAKDTEKDIQEAIDTLLRYQEMRKEDLK